MFLDSLDNANTLRSYAIGVGKAAERLGESRPLATVADDEVGAALELRGEKRRSTRARGMTQIRQKSATR